MKKVIIIAVVAALVLSLGVTAYAVNNNRTSQPDTTQGEQFPAEAPQMDGEKPSGGHAAFTCNGPRGTRAR